MYKVDKDYSCGEDTLRFFFGCIGRFNHYSYFANKLSKKVEGLDNEDEAEIKCAFMSLWTKHTLGITTDPCGSSWCMSYGSEEYFNSYVGKWKLVFEDFENLCISQR